MTLPIKKYHDEEVEVFLKVCENKLDPFSSQIQIEINSINFEIEKN